MITDLTSLPRTAEGARILNVRAYFTGKPCKHGHITYRTLPACSCADCVPIPVEPWKYNPETTGFKKWETHGITRSAYHDILESQHFMCAICSKVFERTGNTDTDHHHATGKIRGILCRACNLGLGMFKDNPSLMRKAIEYIEKNK